MVEHVLRPIDELNKSRYLGNSMEFDINSLRPGRCNRYSTNDEEDNKIKTTSDQMVIEHDFLKVSM